jgi:nicotinate-nucleotide adenylyltransferase
MADRIGMLGGSFNPIHNAHLRIGEEVREYFQLKTLFFIPAFRPPHKHWNPEVTDDHRLAMVRLAIEDHTGFACESIEIQRGGVSYTIDTIQYLEKCYQPDEPIFLVLGGDLLGDLTSWRSWEELVKGTNIVALNREDQRVQIHKERFPFIKTVPNSIRLDITSTMIRNKRKQTESIRYLVPEKVFHYIHEHGLYS